MHLMYTVGNRKPLMRSDRGWFLIFKDDSLFRYERIVNMARPHPRNLKDMVNWMFSGEAPNITQLGEDGRFYKDRWEEKQPETREMVTLDGASKDAFTSWIEYYVIDVYHSLLGQMIHVSVAPLLSSVSSS